MDAAADHPPALADRRKRHRHQGADRGEDDGRVELFRRRLVRPASPGGAQRAGEILRRGVTRAREGEDLAALPDRDLAQNMGGGAESVEPEPAAVARFSQAAPADQSGA